MPVDLYTLMADLPAEILGVANDVSPAGSSVDLTLIEGVMPRFYTEERNRNFTLDIDLTSAAADQIRVDRGGRGATSRDRRRRWQRAEAAAQA